MSSGIYEIRNMVNGHRYIGSALVLRKRKTKHFYDLDRNMHHSGHLQHAYNLYGKENFVFTVLYECQPEELIRCEQEELDVLKPEYNTCPLAISCLGRKPSEETKKKMSEARKGKYSGQNASWFGKHHTEETKRKISNWSVANNPNLGKKLSDERKKEMSKAMKGEKNPHFGKPMSDESKKKLSESQKLAWERRRANGSC